MAKRQITRWHVSRFPATANRAAYAYVILHGREPHGLFGSSHSLVSETFHIPLAPDAPRDNAANQALVKQAIDLSANEWTGRIP